MIEIYGDRFTAPSSPIHNFIDVFYVYAREANPQTHRAPFYRAWLSFYPAAGAAERDHANRRAYNARNHVLTMRRRNVTIELPSGPLANRVVRILVGCLKTRR
jgi:hypothetical protein